MKIRITFYDTVTGDVIEQTESTLRRFVDENPNSPAQYVIRDEIREIGAYITQSNNVRCEVTRL